MASHYGHNLTSCTELHTGFWRSQAAPLCLEYLLKSWATNSKPLTQLGYLQEAFHIGPGSEWETTSVNVQNLVFITALVTSYYKDLFTCWPNKLNCLRAGTLPYLALRSPGLELQALNTLHAWWMNKWITCCLLPSSFRLLRAFTSLMIRRQFKTITQYKWALYGCVSVVL